MVKPKVCKTCREKFTPHNTLQKVCSMICAIEYAAKVREKHRLAQAKSARKLVKEAKDRLKSRGEHLKEAQIQFNKFIRLRDTDDPCICCGKYYDGQYHAGHYLSIGANPELRFSEDNCHKQKSSCNNFKSGNQAQFRQMLIKKIGIERVEALEGPHPPLNLSIDEIKAVKEKYREKVKILERRLEDESMVGRSCDYFGAGGQS